MWPQKVSKKKKKNKFEKVLISGTKNIAQLLDPEGLAH